MWIPVFNSAIILVATIMDYHIHENQRITFLTSAIIASCLFYYIWLHLQFTQEHEQELIAGQRVQIMLSQIKPHFIYNALACIEDLCDTSPQAAKTATLTFSRYLRGNMGSLSQEGLIPFEKELEHTKLYLDLEQIRFENALQVRYQITCVDFRIPTLTLEPIVENAVRHGVRGNQDGRGTVMISTEEYPDAYGVIVSDNGPGFDPGAAPASGAEHVGLRNVRQRLESVCGGSLQIKTAPGEGTLVTILLPKNGENASC